MGMINLLLNRRPIAAGPRRLGRGPGNPRQIARAAAAGSERDGDVETDDPAAPTTALAVVLQKDYAERDRQKF
jgi:hypothetical protein